LPLGGITNNGLPHKLITLIEHEGGDSNRKIPQAQGVNEVKKSEAEWLKAATK